MPAPASPCGTAGTAREIVTEGLEDDLITGLFWLGAVVAAVVVAESTTPSPNVADRSRR